MSIPTHKLTARRALRLLAASTLLAAAACNSDKPPADAQPLGGESTPARSNIPAGARASLDEGNAEFRAGRYDAALAAYRKATEQAPDNAAGYYGIYMVAEKLKRPALGDSAMRKVNSLVGKGQADSALTDSAMRRIHEPGVASPHGTMPPAGALPPDGSAPSGHPPIGGAAKRPIS
jgi:tetratricopeptide (TPR) repeat protein